jgi:transcriptional regulator with XRE-family HTH domain
MTLGRGPDTEWQAALVARLRRLRVATDRGVDELADAAGIDRAAYGDVEAGRTDPGTLTYLDLLGLAEVLGVPPAALLTDHPALPAPRRSPEDQGGHQDVS